MRSVDFAIRLKVILLYKVNWLLNAFVFALELVLMLVCVP